MPLRLVFMGTPDFAVPTLTEIVGQGHDVAAVYTRAPARSGRGMEARKSPVHEAAERFGLPVLTPSSLKGEEAAAAFAAHGADAAIVIAYGMILPKSILEVPEAGCFNVHASLLPRWRGAAPIQRAIMAGDAETGVAIMRMEAGLDTGPVCMEERVAIGPDMTAGDLHDVLARLGADLMVRALGAIERGTLDAVAQSDEGVTYADKIDKAEARIDWSQPAARVHDRIRGLSPFPGAWCEVPAGDKADRVKVLRSEMAEGAGTPGTLLEEDGTVACGDAAIRLVQVQRAGKAPMSGADLLRGLRLEPGTQLL
ncbi:methionyl-tRNA formyltransferase [Amorphus orientalis]|uniref:Methionyl-tRNA formyltransferase n=1 Tax=Amorphus orientalis TaxID=649198 RepID=A0AAE3VS59_9HYPH|nr:methionyl-tRNA formyltransferase [Amorphus orientalis]MDQ0317372.1 methionyl-tRNA formyltransferase [Amorphus orientalis]